MAKVTALRRAVSLKGSLARLKCRHRQLPPTADSAVSFGILAQIAHELGRHVVDEVHLARLEGGHQRRGLDDDLDAHPVEVGQLAAAGIRLPVVRVLFEEDEVALLPLHELERPGADRASSISLALLLDRPGIEDGGGASGGAGEGHPQERIGLGEVQLDRVAGPASRWIPAARASRRGWATGSCPSPAPGSTSRRPPCRDPRCGRSRPCAGGRRGRGRPGSPTPAPAPA